MSSDANQEIYLAKFSKELRRLNVQDASGIAGDVRGHIGEAIADGRSLVETLSALGPPSALARAYAIELVVADAAKTRWSLSSLIRFAMLLLGASIVSLTLVPLLLVLAFTFLLTGAVSFVFAVVELFIVDLPFIQNEHFSPLEALGASIPIFAAGCLFAWLLWRYLRYIAASVRRACAPLRRPSIQT